MVLLGAAILSEVVGTVSLPASVGLTRPLPSLGVVVGYAAAIVLFTRALRHGLTLGVAYGTLSPVQGVGLALIVGGALLLQRRGIDREVRA